MKYLPGKYVNRLQIAVFHTALIYYLLSYVFLFLDKSI